MREVLRLGTARIDTFIDVSAFQRDSGFRDDTKVDFYNHHEAHALPTLFYSRWDDALIVTADGGGDTVHYSHRHFARGVMTTIYGGEDLILTPSSQDSLGKMYAAATKALGFKRNRHEGKVTGLSAMGQPVRAGELAARFSVDDNGRIHSDLSDDRDIRRVMRKLKRGLSREDYAASVQQVLEDFMLKSTERLLARHPAKHLGVSGGVFANVKLNRLLAEKLPLDELLYLPCHGRRWLGDRRRPRMAPQA